MTETPLESGANRSAAKTGNPDAVVAAARALIRARRWFLGLPDDRPLPARLDAALEAAVRALDEQAAA
ncbi:MAG: hypothetical protein MIL41_20410 [Hyphomicrobiales bacterium]